MTNSSTEWHREHYLCSTTNVRAEQERERLERRLTALDREVTRLIDAYQAEVIALSELSDRRWSVEEQGRMLRQRLREIEQQRANRENELRLLKGVEAFCASVRESLEEPSFEVKQKVLQLVVDRIVVEESRVVIQHVVPTWPVRLQTEQQPVESEGVSRALHGYHYQICGRTA